MGLSHNWAIWLVSFSFSCVTFCPPLKSLFQPRLRLPMGCSDWWSHDPPAVPKATPIEHPYKEKIFIPVSLCCHQPSFECPGKTWHPSLDPAAPLPPVTGLNNNQAYYTSILLVRFGLLYIRGLASATCNTWIKAYL